MKLFKASWSSGTYTATRLKGGSFFIKATTLYPGGIRSHDPIDPVSSMVSGDDTTGPKGGTLK
jgi:hypothetical protein